MTESTKDAKSNPSHSATGIPSAPKVFLAREVPLRRTPKLSANQIREIYSQRRKWTGPKFAAALGKAYGVRYSHRRANQILAQCRGLQQYNRLSIDQARHVYSQRTQWTGVQFAAALGKAYGVRYSLSGSCKLLSQFRGPQPRWRPAENDERSALPSIETEPAA